MRGQFAHAVGGLHLVFTGKGATLELHGDALCLPAHAQFVDGCHRLPRGCARCAGSGGWRVALVLIAARAVCIALIGIFLTGILSKGRGWQRPAASSEAMNGAHGAIAGGAVAGLGAGCMQIGFRRWSHRCGVTVVPWQIVSQVGPSFAFEYPAPHVPAPYRPRDPLPDCGHVCTRPNPCIPWGATCPAACCSRACASLMRDATLPTWARASRRLTGLTAAQLLADFGAFYRLIDRKTSLPTRRRWIIPTTRWRRWKRSFASTAPTASCAGSDCQPRRAGWVRTG